MRKLRIVGLIVIILVLIVIGVYQRVGDSSDNKKYTVTFPKNQVELPDKYDLFKNMD